MCKLHLKNRKKNQLEESVEYFSPEMVNFHLTNSSSAVNFTRNSVWEPRNWVRLPTRSFPVTRSKRDMISGHWEFFFTRVFLEWLLFNRKIRKIQWAWFYMPMLPFQVDFIRKKGSLFERFKGLHPTTAYQEQRFQRLAWYFQGFTQTSPLFFQIP